MTNEAVLRISDNKGRHVWPFRVFRYLKSEKDVVKQEKGYPKTGNLFIFLKIFNSFCPGTFALALVPGQRDNGTTHPGLSRDVSWKP